MIRGIVPETVGELMNDPSAQVEVGDRASEAEAAMILAGCRHIPVVRDGRLVGVLSMRDILAVELPSFQTRPEDQVRHLAELRVEDIMAAPPIVAQPRQRVTEAAELLDGRAISCLPVVDDRGTLVGVVTTTDFVAVAVQLMEADAAATGIKQPVATLMRPAPVTIQLGDRINVADVLMKFGHFRHLPVLEGEHLVGMLSDRDILGALRPRLERRLPARRLLDKRAITVEKVMTRWPRTVPPSLDTASAGTIMLTEKVGALPVVEGRRLVGIVTERDYLRYFIAAAVEAFADRPGAA